MNTNTEKIQKTDAEWRQELTPDQYRIMRQKGTESLAFDAAVGETTP